jgi:hypothetical protein
MADEVSAIPTSPRWRSNAWPSRYSEVANRAAGDGVGLQRAAFWTARLSDETTALEALERLPGVADVWVGFLDPEIDGVPRGRFGLLVLRGVDEGPGGLGPADTTVWVANCCSRRPYGSDDLILR